MKTHIVIVYFKCLFLGKSSFLNFPVTPLFAPKVDTCCPLRFCHSLVCRLHFQRPMMDVSVGALDEMKQDLEGLSQRFLSLGFDPIEVRIGWEIFFCAHAAFFRWTLCCVFRVHASARWHVSPICGRFCFFSFFRSPNRPTGGILGQLLRRQKSSARDPRACLFHPTAGNDFALCCHERFAPACCDPSTPQKYSH